MSIRNHRKTRQSIIFPIAEGFNASNFPEYTKTHQLPISPHFCTPRRKCLPPRLESRALRSLSARKRSPLRKSCNSEIPLMLTGLVADDVTRTRSNVQANSHALNVEVLDVQMNVYMSIETVRLRSMKGGFLSYDFDFLAKSL